MALIIALCFATTPIYSQSFSVFDADVSNFPIMKAKFFAFDKNARQISLFSKRDFEIMENGVKREILNVSCKNNSEVRFLSSVIVLDVSGSMGDTKNGVKNIDLAISGAKAWINALPLGKNECAITTFESTNYLNRDFTTDRNSLLTAIDTLYAKGGTNYDYALLKPVAGGLEVTKNGKYKKVIVMLSDGEPSYNPSVDKIVEEAKKQQCEIYAVTLGIKAPKCLKDISLLTGGQYYENVTNIEQIVEIYYNILKIAQGYEPCEISWISEKDCGNLNVECSINQLQLNLSDYIKYMKPENSLVRLDINPGSIRFNDPTIGATQTKQVKVKALNQRINVNNIVLSNPNYDIYPKSFILTENDSLSLEIRYNAKDSGYSYCDFRFESDLCGYIFSASALFSSSDQLNKTLKLISPNGGEVFAVGGDTLIEWSGIPARDLVAIEYSADSGKSWNYIDTARGLTYNWRNIPKPESRKCLVNISQIKSDSIIDIIWRKVYGGIDHDYAYSAVECVDGGYVLAGYVRPASNEYLAEIGTGDYLILKINKNGEIEWRKTYGGENTEYGCSIIQALDGGYLVSGSAKSKTGDVVGNRGLDDAWLLKLNSIGEIEWQKSYGGSSNDEATSIINTNDGGYIFAGYSSSNDLGIGARYGLSDAWVVKLNSKGEIEWQKCYGGSSYDEATSIIQAKDGNYIVAGSTNSKDIDMGVGVGNRDYFVIKIDPKGAIIWAKKYGGLNSDEAKSIIQTKDGGYALAGYAWFDYEIGSKGYIDYLIVKLNEVGDLQWKTCLGAGGSYDYAYSIVESKNEELMVVGQIYGKATISRLAKSGNLRWQKQFEDTKLGRFHSIIIDKNSSDYLVVGESDSKSLNSIDTSQNYNIVAMKINCDDIYIQSDVSDNVFSVVQPSLLSRDIDMKSWYVGSKKDSLIDRLIFNNGSTTCQIKDIKFISGDSSNFSLGNSLASFELKPFETKDIELSFEPSKVGIHKSKILISTNNGSIEQSIYGEGLASKLSYVSNFLDFGVVELGAEKTIYDTVLIKNISSSNLEINSCIMLGPDKSQFAIVGGGGAFTLKPNEARKMSVKFEPKYGGRTSGRIGFKYGDAISDVVVNLYGVGVGGSVRVSDDSAYAGEHRNINLKFVNVKASGIGAIARKYSATLRFESSVLAPINNSNNRVANDSVYIDLYGDIGSDNSLASIPVVAALGDAVLTTVDIDKFELWDYNGNQVDYDFEKESGSFKILGICREGGDRLFNPTGKAGIVSVTPNPAKDKITIEVNNIEDGDVNLAIYNSMGVEVQSIKIDNKQGKQIINVDFSEYSCGMYYVRYKLGTIIGNKTFILSN
jgi:uncharacterized protein YegL